MDSSQWERIQALFHGAADLPRDEQRALLQSECGDDSALLAEVEALLAADAGGASILDRGLAGAAGQMLAEGAPIVQNIGPYRIENKLGEGGMGIVYLASRRDLGNRVAIKTLRDAWLSPARRERFAREQRTLAELTHPLIARLYDADALPDGTPYFVMEYVDGLSLTEYCRRQQCSIEERLRLLRRVCEAVQFAHGHAVIHRDLKPSNILIERDGGVKLLDFGIAKHLENLDVPVDQTRSELRLMTPAYAAPEQIRGEPVGVQTDVYALGVILYELLAGRLPFDLANRTPAEAETIVTSQEPEKPSVVAGRPRNAAWADLDVLCLTAMHKDLARRYRSVEALIRDLDHYLGSEPLEARPDTVRYRVGKFVRRNRRPVALASAALALIVGLVVFSALRITRARDLAVAEAARTQRIREFMVRLLTGGDDEAGPGKDLRVITLLDRGAGEARALDDDPDVQAELFDTLGTLYQSLGELDTADSMLSAALAKRVALDGEASPVALTIMMELAMLRDDQSRFEDAASILRNMLDIGKRHRIPADDERMLIGGEALGRVLTHLNRLEEAIAVVDETLRLRTAKGDPPAKLTDSISVLATAHSDLGHHAEADSFHRRALAIDRAALGERHPSVAVDLHNIAVVQLEWGHYEEAEKLDREAESIREAFYGRDHHETALNLTAVARTLIPQGKLADARALLEEALHIQERAYGKVHARVASTINDLGHVARDQGRLDEAEALYRRQDDIYQSLFDQKHFLKALALANIGSVYLKREDFATAERYYRDAIAVYRDTLPADHPKTAVAEIYLGRALLRQRRYAEAEGHSLAGYDALVKLRSAPERWVQPARQDLVVAYEALGQPEKAKKFRAELEAIGGQDAGISP